MQDRSDFSYYRSYPLVLVNKEIVLLGLFRLNLMISWSSIRSCVISWGWRMRNVLLLLIRIRISLRLLVICFGFCLRLSLCSLLWLWSIFTGGGWREMSIRKSKCRCPLLSSTILHWLRLRRRKRKCDLHWIGCRYKIIIMNREDN